MMNKKILLLVVLGLVGCSEVKDRDREIALNHVVGFNLDQFYKPIRNYDLIQARKSLDPKYEFPIDDYKNYWVEECSHFFNVTDADFKSGGFASVEMKFITPLDDPKFINFAKCLKQKHSTEEISNFEVEQILKDPIFIKYKDKPSVKEQLTQVKDNQKMTHMDLYHIYSKIILERTKEVKGELSAL